MEEFMRRLSRQVELKLKAEMRKQQKSDKV